MPSTQTCMILHSPYLIPALCNLCPMTPPTLCPCRLFPLPNHLCNLRPMALPPPYLSNIFHPATNDSLPGFETCCWTLHCLQSLSPPPPLDPYCHACSYMCSIHFVRNSTGSASHVPTTIVPHTILSHSSLLRNCLEPTSPSTPAQERECTLTTLRHGPGPT